MHKPPAQQIIEARAALSRALMRQRKGDTRQKIVLGATAWNWLCSDNTAASRFIAHVSGMTIREQDKAHLDAAVSELQKTLPVQNS